MQTDHDWMFRSAILICFSVLLATAGCVGPFLGPQTPTPRSDTDQGNIIIDFNSSSLTNDSFSINGTIYVRLDVDEDVDEIWNDPVLCVYDENATLIQKEILNDLHAPTDSTSFDLSASERPARIEIHHPRIYHYDYLDIDRLEIYSGGFRHEPESVITIEDENPTRLQTPAGECP